MGTSSKTRPFRQPLAPGSALHVLVTLVVHLLNVDLVDDLLKTTASKTLAGNDEGPFPKGRIAR